MKNEGIKQLESVILKKVKKWNNLNDSIIISNQRHFESLNNTLNSVKKIQKSISKNISGELVSQDIKIALYHLGEITGEINNEDLLDSIFRDFCIGK